MKLITHLRTISGAVKYTLRHRPTQILIIENLRKNTKLEVPVTLCNIPIDLNGIPITQPMVKGSLVLVQDTANHANNVFHNALQTEQEYNDSIRPTPSFSIGSILGLIIVIGLLFAAGYTWIGK